MSNPDAGGLCDNVGKQAVLKRRQQVFDLQFSLFHTRYCQLVERCRRLDGCNSRVEFAVLGAQFGQAFTKFALFSLIHNYGSPLASLL